MCWFVLVHLVTFLVDLVSVRRRPDRDTDLQILLRHQVRLLERQRPQPRLIPNPVEHSLFREPAFACAEPESDRNG